MSSPFTATILHPVLSKALFLALTDCAVSKALAGVQEIGLQAKTVQHPA